MEGDALKGSSLCSIDAKQVARQSHNTQKEANQKLKVQPTTSTRNKVNFFSEQKQNRFVSPKDLQGQIVLPKKHVFC